MKARSKKSEKREQTVKPNLFPEKEEKLQAQKKRKNDEEIESGRVRKEKPSRRKEGKQPLQPTSQT